MNGGLLMADILTETCLMCNEPLQLRLTMASIISFKALEWPVLCSTCQNNFVLLDSTGIQCFACRRQLTKGSQDAYRQAYQTEAGPCCFDCLHWLESVPLELMNHRALFDYNDATKDWIGRYKYQADSRLAHVMKKSLQVAYQDYKHYRWVILPSSPVSLMRRRFHPVAYLLDLANIPYLIPFDYTGDGVKQADKSKTERLKLVESYRLNDQVGNLIGQDILIFDDVYTTGATMMQAKRLIHSVKGVGEIISLSIGRDQLNK